MRGDVTFPNEFMILYVLLKVKTVFDKLYILFIFCMYFIYPPYIQKVIIMYL